MYIKQYIGWALKEMGSKQKSEPRAVIACPIDGWRFGAFMTQRMTARWCGKKSGTASENSRLYTILWVWKENFFIFIPIIIDRKELATDKAEKRDKCRSLSYTDKWALS